ncbi:MULTISPECIES: hypothetical protein [Aeromonas]|uniref:hypothetical protein n=1 Tax=Aeromonas TaxID=642 RepID=UPI000FDAC102|nr:hypothetical protein [Aeromonas caviae]MDU1144108.1 hypothetical protein [Aeromonas hydrophila]QUM02052.1 hypothetical protein IMO17_02770 [Aeromonas caviae]
MTSPSKESVSLFICDDIRKEEQEKISMLGIYYNRVISVPKSADGTISSLCFIIALNCKPGQYPISFEIIEKDDKNETIFRSPAETLIIREGSDHGLFAAKLANIKYKDGEHGDTGDFILNVKIKSGEYVFPFKIKVL